MSDDLLSRTSLAIGEKLISEFQQHNFCVVGCGGTGALFAEMLVRTGVEKITLVDGDKVDGTNLNRVISFVREDIEKYKTEVLKSRLEYVNPNIKVTPINCCFREYDPNDNEGQKARDAVCNSDLIIITVDKNKPRILCEDLCRSHRKNFMGIGVYIDEVGSAGYECSWRPKTPNDKVADEGYGLGSYAAIVIEATSVAFSMLLHNLKNPDSSNFKYFFKSYKNFVPQESCGIQLS